MEYDSSFYFDNSISDHLCYNKYKLIQLAFGFQLTVEETQALLKAAGHAVLYPRNARDVVIIECLYQRCGIIACNTKLEAQNQPLLE